MTAKFRCIEPKQHFQLEEITASFLKKQLFRLDTVSLAAESDSLLAEAGQPGPLGGPLSFIAEEIRCSTP